MSMKSIKLPAAYSFLYLAFVAALAQNHAAETLPRGRGNSAAFAGPDRALIVSGQIRHRDMTKKQDEYTYIQREEEHKLDNEGE